jgi:leucyl aminopeptidase (aminopeptidase T)
MCDPPDLVPGAETAVQCLAVGPADDVLVLCNEEQRPIADSLAAAADARAQSVVTSRAGTDLVLDLEGRSAIVDAGSLEAKVHIDGTLLEPSIELDGAMLMQKGELLDRGSV